MTRTFTYKKRGDESKLPNTKLISNRSGSYAGTLQSVSKINTAEPFIVTARFTGSVGTVYKWNGKEIDIGSGSSPAWTNCESELLSYFGLPAGSKITSAIWTSESVGSDGQYVRYAKFTGTKPSYDYKATYTCTLYDAAATYSNGYEGSPKYTVIAYAEYEKKPEPAPVLKNEPEEKPDIVKIVIFVGTGVFLLSALIVLIMYILRRRKKEILQNE